MKVGLTGGIGSGKTTVAKLLQQWGIPVYFADERAKTLMATKMTLSKAINRLFGVEVIKDQIINTELMSKQVFSSAAMLESLNRLVHPVVRQDFDHWYGLQEAPYVVQEAAILFETGADALFDATILVVAPEAVRIQRVLERQNVTKDWVLKRMRSQWLDDKKIPLADFVLHNEDKSETEKHLIGIHQQLLNRANSDALRRS